MSTTEKTIDIDLPVSTVYNQWTQFEDFPHFMEGVERVTQIDDKRLHWVAEIAGAREEWDAEIVNQEPDRRIAWRAISGTKNDGVVSFEPVGSASTRVTLDLDVEPEGIKEQLGEKLGLISKRVEGDLKRFKEFIESRGAETGAWRGQV
ncbi:MAG TPA: SRPBCC family protein [Acidimicrobiales bacterium]|jgi:uncharacterized membrane protein|nr:SRPBCC family protein [Acidimicrobiales bacterium]